MKNYQRGFAGAACLVVGALFIIGLGIWWYMNTSNSTGVSADAVPAAAAAAVPSTDTVVATQTLEGGLLLEDTKIGEGAEATAGKTLAMHYTGTLDNGTVFDSSIPRGQVFEFTLGVGQVIPGWDKGIVGMKVGGKRKLTIPPALAYGENGIGPIPGNSTLHFDVELLGIK
jgi:FKBP-type peptidyl-prolyl cis-trans isomerase